MTIYQVELVLPVVGSLGDETTIELQVNNGLMGDLYILFPGGHAGLTNVRILQQSSQIIPFNNGSYLTGDNVIYRFNPATEIDGRGIPLIFSGYNEDDTHIHTVYFTFDIVAGRSGAIESIRERFGF